MQVLTTFTGHLMSNHTIKMTQVSIKIKGNLEILKFDILKCFMSLYNTVNIDNLLHEIKIYWSKSKSFYF